MISNAHRVDLLPRVSLLAHLDGLADGVFHWPAWSRREVPLKVVDRLFLKPLWVAGDHQREPAHEVGRNSLHYAGQAGAGRFASLGCARTYSFWHGLRRGTKSF